MPTKFKLLNDPYMRAWGWTRNDGIRVEVAQIYSGEYDVFLTINGSVVACAVEAYRLFGHGNTTRAEAFRIANTLI